jgi:hypothetical protein
MAVSVITIDTATATTEAAVGSSPLSSTGMVGALTVVTFVPDASSPLVVATGAAKPADSAVALTLTAVGTSKAASPSTATTTGKTSIIVLDEVYRLLATASSGGVDPGASGDTSVEVEDFWDLEVILNDQD